MLLLVMRVKRDRQFGPVRPNWPFRWYTTCQWPFRWFFMKLVIIALVFWSTFKWVGHVLYANTSKNWALNYEIEACSASTYSKHSTNLSSFSQLPWAWSLNLRLRPLALCTRLWAWLSAWFWGQDWLSSLAVAGLAAVLNSNNPCLLALPFPVSPPTWFWGWFCCPTGFLSTINRATVVLFSNRSWELNSYLFTCSFLWLSPDAIP